MEDLLEDRGAALRSSRSPRQIEDWALVLSSIGMSSRVVRTEDGFELHVAPADRPLAEDELCAYEQENRPAPPRDEPPEASPDGARNAAFAVAVAMVLFYGVTGPGGGEVWGGPGAADAARIRSGEWWRLVTALTLHADSVHLAANVLFGTFFVAAVARSLGGGVALLFVLLAGAGGNLLNAALRTGDHVSIGASTAVFGAIGLLTGASASRAQLRGDRLRRVLVPIAAGLGLLAMIGSGEGRIDVFAHLFGLLVGSGIGAVAVRSWERPPGSVAQCLAAAIAAISVVACWRMALV